MLTACALIIPYVGPCSGLFQVGNLEKVIGRAARLPQLRTDMFCSVVISSRLSFQLSDDDLNSITSPKYLY